MNSENLPIVSADSGAALHVAPETSPRSDFEEQPIHSGIGLSDILFVLFRHKWKIICCGLVGLVAASAVYFLVPPAYESQAKLLVRYVLERNAVDGLDSQIKTPTPENQTLLNSEIQILYSSDLLRQVAEALGTNKLGLSPGTSMEEEVESIGRSLNVSVVKETNIISVAFSSGDPSLPMPVVQELVKRYFDKHLEVHRSAGAFNFVAQETADLKKRLAETEAELKELKESVGIISLTEAKADLAAEFGKTQQELDSTISDFAAQQARVKDLERSLAISPTKGAEAPVQPVSGDILEQYKSLIARLTQLQKAESDLLLKYTSESPIVKVKAAQIADLEKQRGALEKQYPTLVGTVTSQGGQEAQPNIASERAILAGFESKLAALKARMSDLQARAKTISQVAPRIQELERKAEVEETNYKHSEASLEKARIDETLDPSRMPNISIVQTPSPAIRVKRNVEKLVVGMACGGFAVGIAIALLIELILDRSVKRSFELETRLQIPLLLTIPYISLSRAQLRLSDAREDGELVHGGNRQEISIVDRRGELLKPFCEAIRDRLGVFFEVNNMAYKPKLVAVTGLAENAGASTLAAGLAAAFSETSEGKVRLIDRPVSTKGFYNMLAEFKRSDLDYVVFDLPCLGDTSATLPLARFMDTVLLVVEAEKSSGNAVKRAYAQLAAKTNVSVVFNKSRSYGRWLEGEM
jgi:polysaccharide biosynthesis transport protein